jgi:hypothetical protein
MEELFLYIALIFGGIILFQKRKIKTLENEAVDRKDAVLQVEQEKIEKEKSEVKNEIKALKPKKVDKDEKAEDYWKDKI